MKFLMTLSFVILAGCASYTGTPRDPSSDEVWHLNSIALNSKTISGECDLSPSVETRRSSLLSTTTVVGNLNTKVCSLKGIGISPITSAVFKGIYLNWQPNVISVEAKIGDIEYANNEADDAVLTSKGYEDVHMTGRGVYKLKASTKTVFKGTCGSPTPVGIYGFRKMMVSCTFADNAGTVSLIKE